ncbi:MAG: TonB-dependent receptor, partial [Bacteroidia bacterium]|nr:TonB-dependent receptor [Bacteroidia bacterium]
MVKFTLALTWGLCSFATAWGQIAGTVKDAETGEGLLGANVVVRGTRYGAVTDEAGRFKINYPGRPPVTLIVTYIGYDSAAVVVNDFSKPVVVSMGAAGVLTEEIQIVDVYISEKLQESPQTIERMDLATIKSTPAANFYDGLGNLKGVDVTAAAMGFKVINTRGFNSTQPVRVLQLIDKVDNASPGLNFSIGNMVGVSELDVQSVDLVVGASGALYGPNAFNGVINMQTKDPFIHQGVSLQIKGGERQWFDGAVRYARAFKNKDGKDKFAFKINGAFMRAYDWEATNADPTPRSELQVYGTGNPGGYDAVNRYGDENPDVRSNTYSIRSRPGLGTFFRTGYWEKDIVDYNTKSIKLDGQASYRLTDSLQLDLGMRFGTGTTVLQGDNRYSLKDFVFLQPKVELKDLRDRFYILSYLSAEDAGKSYDAVLTAQLLQLRAKTAERWGLDYESYWSTNVQPKILRMPGYLALPPFQAGQPPEYFEEYFRQLNAFVLSLGDSLHVWHEQARRYADGRGISLTARPRLEVGTSEFNRAFREIIARPSGGRPGAVVDS